MPRVKPRVAKSEQRVLVRYIKRAPEGWAEAAASTVAAKEAGMEAGTGGSEAGELLLLCIIPTCDVPLRLKSHAAVVTSYHSCRY